MQSVTSRKQQTKYRIAENFRELVKIRFSRRKLSRIAHFSSAKGRYAPNFAEKTFAYSRKTAKFAKVFSLESFPLYGNRSIFSILLRPHFQVPLIGPVYSCSEQDSTNFIRDWRRDSQWAYHIQSEGFFNFHYIRAMYHAVASDHATPGWQMEGAQISYCTTLFICEISFAHISSSPCFSVFWTPFITPARSYIQTYTQRTYPRSQNYRKAPFTLVSCPDPTRGGRECGDVYPPDFSEKLKVSILFCAGRI